MTRISDSPRVPHDGQSHTVKPTQKEVPPKLDMHLTKVHESDKQAFDAIVAQAHSSSVLAKWATITNDMSAQKAGFIAVNAILMGSSETLISRQLASNEGVVCIFDSISQELFLKPAHSCLEKRALVETKSSSVSVSEQTKIPLPTTDQQQALQVIVAYRKIAQGSH